jgi:Flp pilus assembly protein TadG
MATSKQPDNYGLGAGKVGATDNLILGGKSGSSTTVGSGNQTSNSTQVSNSSQTQNSNSTTNNMTKNNQAALDALIRQLAGGGTAEMRQQSEERQGEIDTVQGIRGGYSKDNAFIDAQGLIAQQMRRALESMLPSINRAAEAAGSSGGALRALLLQDAAAKAAESASALGTQTAAQYGGISSNLSGVLEGLTRSDPAVTNALLGALGVAKGAVQNTTGTVNTTGSSTVNTAGSTNTNNTSTQNDKSNSSQYTDYNPTPVRDTSPIYFGPVNEPSGVSQGIGSTIDTLAQLAKQDAWSGYTF